MVLLKSPVSPRWWPVAIAEALAVVKVGNSECEFLKLTPLSRTSAIAGAVCGVTIRPRNPSGTNRMRFLGQSLCADAAVASSVVRPAVSNRAARRIKISPWDAKFSLDRCLSLIFLYHGIVTGKRARFKARSWRTLGQWTVPGQAKPSRHLVCLVSLLRSPRIGSTIIRPPKPRGLRVFLGTKPAIRLGQGGIVAAPLYLIDTDIAGDTRAYGKLALDAASRRHSGMIGEQDVPYRAILVRWARSAQQGAVLSSMSEFLRRHKAALPKSPAIIFRGRFVVLESPFRREFGIQSEPLANEQLVQTDGFAFNGADADMPFPVADVGAQILAVDRTAADQAGQLIACCNAASPCIGVFVDAYLVELRRINAVEPVGHVGELKGAPVPDGRAGSPALACPE